MEEYGYLYNKFMKDVKKFSDKPSMSIKNTAQNTYFIVLGIVCLVLFFVIAKYTG